MSLYAAVIIEATGCAREDVRKIEGIMRDEIFHSTLDWQTRDQLSHGARQAYALLQRERETTIPETDGVPRKDV